MAYLYPKRPIYATFDKERRVHDFGKKICTVLAMVCFVQ